jgi:hypothetical protein
VHPVESKTARDSPRSLVPARVTSHHHQGLGRVGDGLARRLGLRTAPSKPWRTGSSASPSASVAPGGREDVALFRRLSTGTQYRSARTKQAHAPATRSKRVLRIRSHLLRSRPRRYRRRPATACYCAFGRRKAVWIVAFLVIPVIPWLAYGFWRIKRSRL